MVNKDFDEILDQAIGELRAGVSLAQVLAKYPEQAANLEPLLTVAHKLSNLDLPAAEATRMAAVTNSNLERYDEKRYASSLKERVLSMNKSFGTWAATAVAIVLVAVIGLRLTHHSSSVAGPASTVANGTTDAAFAAITTDADQEASIDQAEESNTDLISADQTSSQNIGDSYDETTF